MERYNIKRVEKKWQDIWSSKKNDKAVLDKKKKNFIVLKCFHILRVKFTWDMLEIIQLETF